MRKILVLFIFLFAPLFLSSSEKADNFLKEVDNAYSKYQVYVNYSTPNYNLIVVRGECNNRLSYGIMFYSEISKNYSIKLFGSNSEYRIKTDSRGDVYSLAIKNPSERIEVKVYLGDKEQSLPINIYLDDFSSSDLNGAIEGIGNGTSFDRLTKGSLRTIDIYMIVCAGVIITCFTIILIYYFRRSGMFDKKIRSEGVFNFKEFIESNIEEEHHEEVPIKDIIDLEEDKYHEVVEEKQEEKNVYNKLKDESFYSDEASGFPLEDYLKDKGFILDYSLIDDEEKNKIMLELIKLKDNRKITNDEYLEEVYKLWKK